MPLRRKLDQFSLCCFFVTSLLRCSFLTYFSCYPIGVNWTPYCILVVLCNQLCLATFFCFLPFLTMFKLYCCALSLLANLGTLFVITFFSSLNWDAIRSFFSFFFLLSSQCWCYAAVLFYSLFIDFYPIKEKYRHVVWFLKTKSMCWAEKQALGFNYFFVLVCVSMFAYRNTGHLLIAT